MYLVRKNVALASFAVVIFMSIGLVACGDDNPGTPESSGSSGSSSSAGNGGGTAQGGSGNNGNGPVNGNEAATIEDGEQMCKSICDQKVKCGKGSDGCENKCIEEFQTSLPNIRKAYIVGFKTCMDTLSCEEKMDKCGESYSTADPDFPNVKVMQDCLKKRETCVKEQVGFSDTFDDDICYDLTILINAKRAEAALCMEKSCTDYKACLKEVWSTSN
jgi:hypothetical protein